MNGRLLSYNYSNDHGSLIDDNKFTRLNKDNVESVRVILGIFHSGQIVF